MTGSAVLTVELLVAPGQWAPVGEVGPQDPPGSVSSDEPGGSRRIYLFGWRNGAADPAVWEPTAGVDVGQLLRVVTSFDMSVLSDLAAPFELTISRAGAGPRHLRFALRESNVTGEDAGRG